MTLLERDSLFTGLFGPGRGLPGRRREPVFAPADPLAHLEVLLGRSLPAAGLTLLVGAAGAGKSVVASYLASQLAASGLRVHYLDCDGNQAGGWLSAQPQGALPVMLSRPMRRADGLDTAKDLVTSGHERVVIIDSLDAIINAGPGSPFGARLAALTEAGRLHMIPLLATCTPETLNLSTQTSGRLGTRASLILQVHCERSGPGGHEVVVSHRASGRQAGLLISEGSSLISLLSR